MGSWIEDLRVALRRLRKRPAFTMTAVTILALGLGATTVLFSIIHAVLLEPLPYPEAQRIYRLFELEQRSGEEKLSISEPTFRDWQEDLGSFAGFATIRFDNFNLTGALEPQQVRAARVNRDFFDIFDAEPARGRIFSEEELGGVGEKTVLVGHDLWRRQLGGRIEILGSALELDGEPHTIVGIMPEGFGFPSWADLWLPLGELSGTDRGERDLTVYGLLADGSEQATAAVELETLAERFRAAHPATHEGLSATLRPLLDEEVGEVRSTLWMLFGAVLGVLLIVCLNVAGLQLARGLERRRELALRCVLGAGRRRVIRELLTESLLLASLGGGLGILLAGWAFDVVLALAPAGIPRLSAASIGAPVAVFALAAVVLTGLLAGWLPAVSSTRFSLGEALEIKNRQSLPGRGTSLRSSLVVGQIALTIVLLATAGLLFGSLQKLLDVDSGFDTDRVLSVGIVLPPNLYDRTERNTFVDEIRLRLEASPEFESAAVGNSFPWSGIPGTRVRLRTRDRLAEAPGDDREAIEKIISEGYFETLGATLRAGRPFGPQDRESRDIEPVVINDALARQLWPGLGRPPIGEQLELPSNGGEPTVVEIVGVVSDLRYGGPGEPIGAQLFRLYALQPWNYFNIAARTSHREPARAMQTLRQTIWEIDPQRPIFGELTAERSLAQSLQRPRFGATLLGSFALVALLLASVGIYGLMSFVVGQRRREIGIRMALGARRHEVRRMVWQQGMRLVLGGLALGIPSAFLATRWIEGMLFGIEPGDPLVLVSALLVLVATAWLAIHLPAARASRIEPVKALRED